MKDTRFYVPKRLFSWDTNPKTIKGQQHGFKTAVLYMAPSDMAGVGDFCPMAWKANCRDTCLYKAGRGAFTNTQLARINKTKYFVYARKQFMTQMVEEIAEFVFKTRAEGFTPLIRPNGTQDIQWEKVDVFYDGMMYANIMEIFPDEQFYDYTKIPNRKPPPNYDLTFSYSGTDAFQPYVKRALKAGMRMAVVFRNRPEQGTEFLDQVVLDGDDSDLRHLDPPGSIVALYAKGPAKKDTSGFVVHN